MYGLGKSCLKRRCSGRSHRAAVVRPPGGGHGRIRILRRQGAIARSCIPCGRDYYFVYVSPFHPHIPGRIDRRRALDRLSKTNRLAEPDGPFRALEKTRQLESIREELFDRTGKSSAHSFAHDLREARSRWVPWITVSAPRRGSLETSMRTSRSSSSYLIAGPPQSCTDSQTSRMRGSLLTRCASRPCSATPPQGRCWLVSAGPAIVHCSRAQSVKSSPRHRFPIGSGRRPERTGPPSSSAQGERPTHGHGMQGLCRSLGLNQSPLPPDNRHGLSQDRLVGSPNDSVPRSPLSQACSSRFCFVFRFSQMEHSS